MQKYSGSQKTQKKRLKKSKRFFNLFFKTKKVTKSGNYILILNIF